MIKWGTTFGSHDGALAVFQDDELVFASDAERWSRKKNDSVIPDNLIKYAEDNWGRPDEVYFYEDYKLKDERRRFAGQTSLHEIDFKYRLIQSNHHMSHARYGYWTSPFLDCTVLVIDAIGEWDTLTQWKVIDGNFKKQKSWRYPKSIGLFYSAMTQAAGWKPNEEEYILMGASAVKKHKIENYNIIKELWDNDVNFHTGININFDRFEIASIAQEIYEEEFKKIINEIEDDNLVFVGGCALNVSANRFLTKFNTFIPCNPGDGGSAIGCVIDKKIPANAYLGYEIPGKYPVAEIIKELKENGVVGVANGKAEFGPRALGNRSLLSDPWKYPKRTGHVEVDVKKMVNEIKGREEFRPFAPMILKENVNRFFRDGISSPFMNGVREACHEIHDHYPSIMHIDGTSRIQEVTEEPHKTLLEEWEKETGCPMLLNTSLNIKGEPIINNKAEAKNFEVKTGVKVL
tara:strand:- start:20824 stop:22206 length:1383 start_codon:yes stop_codon:yes gene_type:complete